MQSPHASVCCITHSSQLMVNPWLTIRPSCLNRPAEEPTDGVRHLRFDRLDRGAGPAPPACHLLDFLVEHLFVLLLATPDSGAPPLAADFAAAGFALAGEGDCAHLVRETLRTQPDVLVCWAPRPGVELLESVATLQAQQAVYSGHAACCSTTR